MTHKQPLPKTILMLHIPLIVLLLCCCVALIGCPETDQMVGNVITPPADTPPPPPQDTTGNTPPPPAPPADIPPPPAPPADTPPPPPQDTTGNTPPPPAQDTTGNTPPPADTPTTEEPTVSTDATDNPSEPTQPGEPVAALPGLPADVAGYTQWLKLNAKPIPPVPGGDPHNGTKNVYVNKTREDIAPNGEQQFPYPDGSIVIKEAYRPGKDFVGLIAIMRKKAGVDSAHNDWEFIEYVRNAPNADFSVIAKDGVCWGCHSRVEDIDYVFTELE